MQKPMCIRRSRQCNLSPIIVRTSTSETIYVSAGRTSMITRFRIRLGIARQVLEFPRSALDTIMALPFCAG